MKITASLVLYRNDPLMIDGAIRSIIGSDVTVTLSIVDNSPEPIESAWLTHSRVRYDHPGTNLGFGAGHNRAFAAVANESDAHFIINPDIVFDPGVVRKLADVFERSPEVTVVMPAIFDEAGEQQHLCKALPTPMNLIVRRFIPFAAIRQSIDDKYEFRHLPREGQVDIPSLSGCFLGVRSTAFSQVRGFDDRFFMYMEDVDLVRRLGDLGRTVYIPSAHVVHGHARSSYRFGKLMFVHMGSAIRYFPNWGWIHDPIRASRNAAAHRTYRVR